MITIDGYIIDAALAEEHTLNSETTKHPIEKGALGTDHQRKLPDTITLDCVVSDHPMPAVVTARGLGPTDGATPSEDAYKFLQFVRDRGTAVTITTSLGTHENMMLTALGIPRRVEDGEALRFRVTFELQTFVENERTVVRIAVPQQAKKVNRGNKPSKTPPDTPPAPGDDKKASILWKLIH